MRKDFLEAYSKVIRNIVGRREEVRLILSAIEKRKPVLLVGLPGVSKTTILKEIAAHLKKGGNHLLTVTGDEQLTAFSLIGTFDPSLVLQGGFRKEYFTEGPLLQALKAGGILYIEELNRAPSGVLNVLMTALSDGYVDVPKLGRVYAEEGFSVIGACNPLDEVGTGRLSRGLADRFVVLALTYQSRDEELEIVRRRTSSRRERLIAYAVDVARASREHPELKYGSSVRGPIDFVDLLEAGGLEGLDVERLLFTGCTAYGSKVQVRPGVSRTATEIIREIMLGILNKDYGGKVEGLLDPPRSPSGPGVDLEEGSGEAAEGSSEGEGPGSADLRSKESGSPVGLRREGSSAPQGKSDAVPMVDEGRGFSQLVDEVSELKSRRNQPMSSLEEIKRYAAELVLRKSGKVIASLGERSSTFLSSEPWSLVGGGELDVDRTLQRYAEKGGKPEIDDFYLYRRASELRNFGIFVDHSGSMAGPKLVLAAVLAGILAQLSERRKGDYAVFAFDHDLLQIKGLGHERAMDEVINDLLFLPEGRSTDLSLVLRKAFDLFEQGYPAMDLVIISDFMPTKGVKTFEGLARLTSRLPTLYIGFTEDKEAAITLYAEGKPTKFNLYEWWARRMVGDDRFHDIKDLDDLAGLVSKLMGHSMGELI